MAHGGDLTEKASLIASSPVRVFSFIRHNEINTVLLPVNNTKRFTYHFLHPALHHADEARFSAVLNAIWVFMASTNYRLLNLNRIFIVFCLLSSDVQE